MYIGVYCKVCSQPSGKSNDIYDKNCLANHQARMYIGVYCKVCSQPSGKSNDIFDKTV